MVLQGDTSTKAKFDEAVFVEMEKLVLASENPEIIIRFYRHTDRNEKAEEVKESAYEALLTAHDFMQAIDFAKIQGMDRAHITRAAGGWYEQLMAAGNIDAALGVPERYGVEPERVAKAARIRVEAILAAPDLDPEPAIRLARDVLHDAVLLQKAVLSAFGKGLCSREPSRPLKKLIVQFPDYIDPIRTTLFHLLYP